MNMEQPFALSANAWKILIFQAFQKQNFLMAVPARDISNLRETMIESGVWIFCQMEQKTQGVPIGISELFCKIWQEISC